MSAPSASTLANEADRRLFRAVTQGPDHVLRKLLPEARRVSYHLRPRVHGFQLPANGRYKLYSSPSLQRHNTNSVLVAGLQSFSFCIDERYNRFTCDLYVIILAFCQL